MINIGENLRKARNRKQYSLEYVALKLEVSIPTIQRMEMGNKRLCLELFTQYCKLLGISPGSVFSDNSKSSNDKIVIQLGNMISGELNQFLPHILSQILESEVFITLIKEWKTDKTP